VSVGFLRRQIDGAGQPDAGIFAGLFVAAPEAVEAWDLSGVTSSDWPALEFKRLDPVRLGSLEAILTGRAYADIAGEERPGLVRNGGADGPWITIVRPALVNALAVLTPDGASTAAGAWADTDEFKVRPSDPPRPQDVADLTGLLNWMTELSKRSLQDGQPVYLLMAL
jgi:hypothetical protein